jgi:hypothetical protein
LKVHFNDAKARANLEHRYREFSTFVERPGGRAVYAEYPRSLGKAYRGATCDVDWPYLKPPRFTRHLGKIVLGHFFSISGSGPSIVGASQSRYFIRAETGPEVRYIQ